MNISAPFIARRVATTLLTLGIAIIGGLVFSQMLTLFTTPVIYLYFDRLAARLAGRRPANPLAPGAPAE